MLNEERIRLMAKMAAYENTEGKKDIALDEYFRGDYISFQVWKSAIYGTAGFCVGVALYLLYNLETFLEELYKMDVVEFCRDIAGKYAVAMGVYIVISYCVYVYRYQRAKKHMKSYFSGLNQLYAMYSRGRNRQN